MSESKEKFFGTYFDRDSVLRISNAANIISWVILTIYILIWIFTMALFFVQYFNGLYFAKGSETFLTTASRKPGRRFTPVSPTPPKYKISS